RGNKYKVVGILEAQGSSQTGAGDRAVFIPLENARILLANQDPNFELKVSVSNALDIDLAMGEATGLMRRIRQDPLNRPNSFEISRSQTLADRLANITGYLTVGGAVVGFITLLGASIGLMNIMLVSVTERTREIGIRKALGATPQRIRQQFLIEAIVICQIGGVGGIFLGILLGNAVAIFFNVEGFFVPWLWIIIALLVCLVVGVTSGFYPAYKASRLDPIESLRFE
ncbi:MAG: FtsX-like permease family protein, partial [Bacteroidia bacterium]|nr:FtsX-like permease family protein [Bacteroidia bacterium]